MGQRGKRGGIFVLALVSVSAVTASTVAADDAAPDATPVVGVIGAPLSDLSGPVDVVLRLSEPALAEAVAPNATRNGTLPDGAAQDAILHSVEGQQHRVLAAAGDLGATELGSISRSLNAVMVHADASVLPDLAAIPGVTAVSPLPSYSVAAPTDTAADSGRLDQARQYLHFDQMAAGGFDGSGARVAVIDSGIDYTHANLGGPGTPAAYSACYGTPPGPGVSEAGQPRNAAPVDACAALFGAGAPKVVGGFDFVGEAWPNGPVAPDPNPIDFQGHGTHVADILAGRSADGTHTGLAPGAQLYAFKACSAVTTGCNGAAVLQAIDRALDPNQDGNMNDAVDVINMSLGTFYGQPESADTLAVNNAVRAGVVVAVAAGNDGDRPWIVGQPSIAAGAIAVAETALPIASLLPLSVVTPTIAGLPGNTVTYAVPQTWAPFPTAVVSGTLTIPEGPAGATGTAASSGCDASNFANFDASVARVALIDRGTCDASLKVSNAAAAGAAAVVLVNDRAGAPPTLNAGLGTPSVPAVFITQDKGALLKTAAGQGPVQVSLDPAAAISRANTMEMTSSRGPSQMGAVIKPDVGAPGAWTSAVAGTGSIERPFSGTSGAAPVVAAAAAVLRQAFRGEDAASIKRRLVSTADPDNHTVDLEGHVSATPVTRVGSGEVRPSAAWTGHTQIGDPGNGDGNLAVGVQAATGKKYVVKKVTVKNTADHSRSFRFDASFGAGKEALADAITVVTPDSVTVAAGKTASVSVIFAINADRLPSWVYYDRAQNLALAGATGNASTVLDSAEVDGHLTVRDTAGAEQATIGWQALPKRAAATVSRNMTAAVGPDGTAPISFRNLGVEDGTVDAFNLTGSSDRLPTPAPGQPGAPGSNEAVIDLADVGVRDSTDGLQFAVTQYTKRPTPEVPGLVQIEIDADRDGTFESVVYNDDYNAFSPLDGRTMVWAGKRGAGARQGPVDADVDSTNQIFTVPLTALGLGSGQTFTFRVLAFDRYFTGHLEDSIGPMTYTVGAPKFGLTEGATIVAPARAASAGATVRADPAAGPSSATGLLLLYRVNGGTEFSTVSVS